MHVATTAIVLLSLIVPVFPVAAEEVYQVGGDVTAPKLVHKVEPNYTERARKKKIQGTVALSVVVSSDGIPKDIEITKSLDRDLDAQAIKAVSQWRFIPAEKNGKPVAVKIKIQLNLHLI